MQPSQLVDKQIQEDFDKFYNSICNAKLSTPNYVIDFFKMAVMSLSPNFHQLDFNKIKVIISKQPNQLTVGEVTDVLNMILNTPLNKLFENLDEAVEKMVQFKRFVLSYNNYVHEFEENLKLKKVNLMALSGHKNGLKIIN